MAISRILQKELVQWRRAEKHEPILLRGARQVGKTFMVEQFANDEFQTLININFELPRLIRGVFTFSNL